MRIASRIQPSTRRAPVNLSPNGNAAILRVDIKSASRATFTVLILLFSLDFLELSPEIVVMVVKAITNIEEFTAAVSLFPIPDERLHADAPRVDRRPEARRLRLLGNMVWPLQDDQPGFRAAIRKIPSARILQGRCGRSR